jgi:hypothetical protein
LGSRRVGLEGGYGDADGWATPALWLETVAEGLVKGHPKDKTPNVRFLQVDYCGWPLLVAMALADVQPGEELLVDYGVEYWTGEHR